MNAHLVESFVIRHGRTRVVLLLALIAIIIVGVYGGYWLLRTPHMPELTNLDPAMPDDRRPQPVDELEPTIKSKSGMELALIKPGEFQRGASSDDRQALPREKPAHPVKLTRPFYLGKTEVTVGQFRQFVKETRYVTDAEKDGLGIGIWVKRNGRRELDRLSEHRRKRATWLNPAYEIGDDQPVTCVSYADVDAFCRWLSEKDKARYRLPTEAEWEYACRAGSKSPWYFGDSNADLKSYEWYAGNANGRPKPVAEKKPNAFGLYDMLGNVREMCLDWFGDYQDRELADPRGPASGEIRVGRGGDIFSPEEDCRCSYRGRSDPRFRFNFVGFRVCRTP